MVAHAKPAGMSSYETYLREEWDGFLADASRGASTLEAVEGMRAELVLDIGCGAGQELIPLVERGALGIGIDPAPEIGRAPWGERRSRVAFTRGIAEQLPFRANTFDVIICRVALPYMDNRVALAEMARVLRSGGRLLLKIHAAPYYWNKFRQGIARRDPKFSIHAVRVLLAGALYHVLGVQVRKVISNETFQSEWLLRRELARSGMSIRGHLRETNPLTPSFVIEKS